MFTLIFEVTDTNEIFLFNPKTGELHQEKLSQADADFYRKRLDEEILIRTYFNKIPGEIIGRYIYTDSFLNPANTFFHFIPATK